MDGEIHILEHHLVGTLDGVEVLLRLGADIVAVVTHYDEAVDVATLCRGTGTYDVEGDVHLGLTGGRVCVAGGVVALAVDDDVGLATKDTTGVEVGIVMSLTPVGAIVYRRFEDYRCCQRRREGGFHGG